MPPAEEPSIPITSLPIQELANLKQRIEQEYEASGETQQQIRRLIGHFNATIASIQTLAESKQGQPLLLPLTGSLYASGQINDPNKVLVDVGTGYYVEMSTDDGVSYCSRKIAKLKATLDESEKDLLSKKNALKHIQMVLQQKLASLQQQQQQQQKTKQ